MTEYAICQEKFLASEEVVKLSCGQIFGRICITCWLDPICSWDSFEDNCLPSSGVLLCFRVLLCADTRAARCVDEPFSPRAMVTHQWNCSQLDSRSGTWPTPVPEQYGRGQRRLPGTFYGDTWNTVVVRSRSMKMEKTLTGAGN